MKTCTKCGETKPLTDFYHARARCKLCIKTESALYAKLHRKERTEKNREWQSNNREKVRESCKKWNSEHKDKLNETLRKWRALNPEKVKASKARHYAKHAEKERASRKKWYAENRDKAKEAYAKWAASNPEARRLINQNRRAAKREAGGRLSNGLVKRLFELQRGKCACGCNRPLGDDYHRDHRMPLALGGTNTDDNIQLLRKTCNLQKGAMHPIEFMQKRGFLI